MYQVNGIVTNQGMFGVEQREDSQYPCNDNRHYNLVVKDEKDKEVSVIRFTSLSEFENKRHNGFLTAKLRKAVEKALRREQMIAAIIDADKSLDFSDKLSEIYTLEYYYKDEDGEVSTFEDVFDCIDTSGDTASVWFICGTGHDDINVPLADLTDISIERLYNCINKIK